MTQENGDKLECVVCFNVVPDIDKPCPVCGYLSQWAKPRTAKPPPPSEPLDHRDLSSIKSHVNHIADLLDPARVLTPIRRGWLAKHLTNFVIDATLKFIKGQLEHGDNIEAVNLPREIKNELIDTFFYHAALTDPLKRPTTEDSE